MPTIMELVPKWLFIEFLSQKRHFYIFNKLTYYNFQPKLQILKRVSYMKNKFDFWEMNEN